MLLALVKRNGKKLRMKINGKRLRMKTGFLTNYQNLSQSHSNLNFFLIYCVAISNPNYFTKILRSEPNGSLLRMTSSE